MLFFDNPLMATQQHCDGNKRRMTTACPVGDLQQHYVFNSTFCTVTVETDPDPSFTMLVRSEKFCVLFVCLR